VISFDETYADLELAQSALEASEREREELKVQLEDASHAPISLDSRLISPGGEEMPVSFLIEELDRSKRLLLGLSIGLELVTPYRGARTVKT